jgi:hypothetical protein
MENEFLALKNSLVSDGANTFSVSAQTIERVKRLYDFTQANNFFSENEELHDLSSYLIKYLSVPFLYALALLLSKSSSSRLSILEQAKTLTDEFFLLVKTYGISFEEFDLKNRVDKLIHRKKIEELKIFSFLLDKISTSDEEKYRDVSINFIKYCTLIAQWELEMQQRELNVLNDNTPPDNLAYKKPINTFVLDPRRLKFQNVFRPSHSLPTMTVQEFYDKTYKNFNPDVVNKIPEKTYTDDNDEEDIYVKRMQDEFNDLNPRSSGNRLYRS